MTIDKSALETITTKIGDSMGPIFIKTPEKSSPNLNMFMTINKPGLMLGIYEVNELPLSCHQEVIAEEWMISRGLKDEN